MIYRSQANCSMCAHYQSDQRCKAFSGGIPSALWSGEHLHREPYPGDGGFRYESRRLSFPDIDAEELEPIGVTTAQESA